MFAAITAAALQPQVMVQGYLTNAAGTPYTTAQAVQFKVYQGGIAATAGTGTVYYEETATITPSASGVFNHPLGSGTPSTAFLVVAGGATIPNSLSTTTFDTSSAVFLEISVGGTILLPRVQMLSVPYASLATTAENLKPTTSVTVVNITASSGTFTATGNTQYSIATASGISVGAGGVTAAFFKGDLYGNVNGSAGSVAANSITAGTFGSAVLLPAGNLIGGVASTNTANVFPLVQTMQGGVVGSSGSFMNGVTAGSGTFTATGNTQYSIATASGISVGAGGVTAAFFDGTHYGDASGMTGISTILRQYTSNTTAASNRNDTAIPNDDTIPSVGEGTQFASITVTPVKAASMMFLIATAHGAYSGGAACNRAFVCVFNGVTNLGCGATQLTSFPGAATAYIMVSSGGTAARTYTARFGCESADGFQLNGISTGRLLGGAMTSGLYLWELGG
ncbi:MAG: hypothetical protein A2V88_09230 [Elusimicrobia bacterium RBG_16_66_12]|nr:MAG: hypothetical protein A2V88_09230 [Elusimicrobia bacterium RBG_16_66_12]